jgi:hypothetical protein
MSGDRERDLRAGKKEEDGFITLYWEPYAEKGVIKHAFTVDIENYELGRVRYRYDTLAEADAKVAEMEVEIAVYWAKRAFKLRN